MSRSLKLGDLARRGTKTRQEGEEGKVGRVIYFELRVEHVQRITGTCTFRTEHRELDLGRNKVKGTIHIYTHRVWELKLQQGSTRCRYHMVLE